MEKNWYAPLIDNKEIAPVKAIPEAEEKSTKKRKKEKTVSYGRIIGILLIFAALILASVFLLLKSAVRSIEDSMIETGFFDDFDDFDYSLPFDDLNPDVEPEEMPEDYKEFFQSYYTTSEESDFDEITIEKISYPIDYKVKFEKSSGDMLTLEELYEQCNKTVTGIKGFLNDDPNDYQWGTGVILTSDGLIITNAHVVEGCSSAAVIALDKEYPALLVGYDAISDIALLKIDAKNLPTATFADSDKLKIGQGVAAIGNPLGEEFSCTLTSGILSAVNREIPYLSHNMYLLQTDAALNNGNSGGPLFNMYGQVIGITNMKMMSSFYDIESIGLCIPSRTVETVVDSLLSAGVVSGRTSLGLTVGNIPDVAVEKYNIPLGVYILSVSENSDALKQGLQEGDIIIKVNGEEVDDYSQVSGAKEGLKVGDTIDFTIWRDGETLEFTVALVDSNDIS